MFGLVTLIVFESKPLAAFSPSFFYSISFIHSTLPDLNQSSFSSLLGIEWRRTSGRASQTTVSWRVVERSGPVAKGGVGAAQRNIKAESVGIKVTHKGGGKRITACRASVARREIARCEPITSEPVSLQSILLKPRFPLLLRGNKA